MMVIKKSSSVRVQFGPATSLLQFQHMFLLVKSDDPAGAPKKVLMWQNKDTLWLLTGPCNYIYIPF